MKSDALVTGAQQLAERELAAALPRRWRHVQAVGQRAAEIADTPAVDGDVLVAAAWLHDIGYAPELVARAFTRSTVPATYDGSARCLTVSLAWLHTTHAP